jgi:hypothetical protein
MRKCYLSAVAATVKIDGFAHEDDSFLDLIDIRLALLFDRAGWLPASLEKVTGKEESDVIENELKDAEDALKAGGSQAEPKTLVDKVTGWEANGK